jgi:phosphoadenosine phosphosulfate reductase
MRDALAGVDLWITGLSRSQSGSRAETRVVEWDWQYHVLKISPLAGWDRARVWEYIQEHDVPYNELHDRGYPTLGCTHCTVPVAGVQIGTYSREGRWAGMQKSECGLHLSPR